MSIRRLSRLLSMLVLALAMVALGAGTAGAQDPAATQDPAVAAEPSPHPPLPADSGAGRRVVYSVGQQRVWWVEADGRVVNSYLVSGKAGTPNVGTYHVYSRSRYTTSVNGSARMEFMIRFARGRSAAIGFHSIPVNGRGVPLQSEAQLGTPLSAGCVRQRWWDAAGLWDWAPIGTQVNVVK